MKIEAKDGKAPCPYIYEYYNVAHYAENVLSPNQNVLVNLLNSLIAALNDHGKYLPRFIIMLPEDDILCFVDYFAYGVSALTGRCLTWLVNQLDRCIDAHKDQLRRKNPGDIVANEPKIVWVKMMDRPDIAYNDMLAIRNKYNKILEEILASKKNHYIMDVGKDVVHPVHFMQNNNLNTRGKNAFWNVVDRNIELFDYHKIHLLPQGEKQAMNLLLQMHSSQAAHHFDNPATNTLQNTGLRSRLEHTQQLYQIYHFLRSCSFN